MTNSVTIEKNLYDFVENVFSNPDGSLTFYIPSKDFVNVYTALFEADDTPECTIRVSTRQGGYKAITIVSEKMNHFRKLVLKLFK